MDVLPDTAGQQLSKGRQNENETDDAGDGSRCVADESADRDRYHSQHRKVQTRTDYGSQDTRITQRHRHTRPHHRRSDKERRKGRELADHEDHNHEQSGLGGQDRYPRRNTPAGSL